MYSVSGDATDSLEARVLTQQSNHLENLYKIYGESIDDQTVRTLVGEAMREFIDPSQIRVGYRGLSQTLDPVTADQIKEVARILPLAQKSRDDLAKQVSNSGIQYKVLDDYGLAQRYNFEKLNKKGGEKAFREDIAEALRIQNKGKEPSIEDVDRIVDGLTGEQALKGAKDVAGESNSIFVKGKDGTYKMRRLSEFFEKNRKIKDKDAVKYLTEKGWINLDSKDVLQDYGFQSIKLANFAETLGANGELVNYALDASAAAFNKQVKET